MIVTMELGGRRLALDLSKAIDLSRPVRFDEHQVRAFGADPARTEPMLSVREGAGCNCPVFTFSAHLHGTHTECVGHISRQAHVVQDVLAERWCLARVVTLEAESRCGESYSPELRPGDRVLTRQALEGALGDELPEALVVRTRGPETAAHPFFSNEAMVYIAGLGVNLLLVDTPSVDRLEDEGRLSNHHIFWGVEQGAHEVPLPSEKTITELIQVPAQVEDGLYVLHLTVSNIRSDAAPSRPTLYRFETV